MAYVKTIWAPGDLITAAKLNNAEAGIANLHGVNNQTVALITSLFQQIDTRNWTATTWNSDNLPTHIDIMDGATVVATLDITWNMDLKPTQVIAVAGGKTVTYTVTWLTGPKFVSIAKAVV